VRLSIFNPWRRIRELEAHVCYLEAEVCDLEADMAVLERSLHIANDRYDGIRNANLQLRDCLALYRTEGSA